MLGFVRFWRCALGLVESWISWTSSRIPACENERLRRAIASVRVLFRKLPANLTGVLLVRCALLLLATRPFVSVMQLLACRWHL